MSFKQKLVTYFYFASLASPIGKRNNKTLRQVSRLLLAVLLFVFLLYLYAYLLDSHESVRGIIYRTRITPICFQRCQGIAVRLKLFYFHVLGFYKDLRLRFKVACQEHQDEENKVFLPKI